MKKIKYLFITILLSAIMLLSSCAIKERSVYKVLVPSGTPLLALSTLFDEYSGVFEHDIVLGSSPLVAGMVKGEYDFIVAPVTLGAKMYNNNSNYMLYKTFVYGNYYLASTKEITSFKELENKKVIVFGKNTSPDLMLQLVLDYYEVNNVEFEYVDDVATCNTYLASKKAEYIISAEPSLTVLSKKISLFRLSLQDEWEKVADGKPFPQAALFIKKDLVISEQSLNYINQALNKLNNPDNYSSIVNSAIKISDTFSSMGEKNLSDSFPRCNLKTLDRVLEIESIKYYFDILEKYGLITQIGGAKPLDEFYYK